MSRNDVNNHPAQLGVGLGRLGPADDVASSGNRNSHLHTGV